MRVLFLSPSLPYPVRHGGQLRAFGLLRCLAGFAEVRALAIADIDDANSDLTAARSRLGEMGVSLEVFPATGPRESDGAPEDERRMPDAAAHFRSPELAAALAGQLSDFRPDLIHLEEMVMAQYAPHVGHEAPRILDRQKLESVYHRALARLGSGDVGWHRREAARFEWWESRLLPGMDRVLTVGAEDAARLAPRCGTDRVQVVPNGVADELSRPADRTRDIEYVLLYGCQDYPPNAGANERYFREVWPRLREKVPGLKTLVVGSGTASASTPRRDPRVEQRGFVDDVAALLTGPGVLVAPMQVGGGARNKLLEALAAGMPVVSSAVGAEGLALEPGQHCLLAETPTQTVDGVLRLLREPASAESLSRAGAELVERRHRWPIVEGRLRDLCQELIRNRAAASRVRRVLLLGVGPLPSETGARALSFPGHRTAQFLTALEEAGFDVETVLLDEEAAGGGDESGVHLLASDAYLSGESAQRLHDAARPDVIVSAGGYHAARAASLLVSEAPRWFDLAGDLAAEGQLRDGEAGGAAQDQVSVLRVALGIGDRFSVVGESQRLAVLGQLGVLGRLSGAVVGQDPVGTVPLACPGPDEVTPPPTNGFDVLWLGGYNTWMDERTLFDGLEAAMERRETLRFVSQGGPVPGHEEQRHARFWERARGSRFASRFVDLGRGTRGEAVRRLQESHVVVCLSRPCLEAELGSRLRLVEAMAYGRSVVATNIGDLAHEIDRAKAGLLVPARDAAALCEALLRLAGDRAELCDRGSAGRALWEREHRIGSGADALVRFVRQPQRWPAPLLGDAADAAERVRLQAELAAIRSSLTFRALRFVDRILGRGR